MGGMTGAVFLGQFFSPIAFQPILNIVDLSTGHIYAGIFAALVGVAFFVYTVIYKRRSLQSELA